MSSAARDIFTEHLLRGFFVCIKSLKHWLSLTLNHNLSFLWRKKKWVSDGFLLQLPSKVNYHQHHHYYYYYYCYCCCYQYHCYISTQQKSVCNCRNESNNCKKAQVLGKAASLWLQHKVFAVNMSTMELHTDHLQICSKSNKHLQVNTILDKSEGYVAEMFERTLPCYLASLERLQQSSKHQRALTTAVRCWSGLTCSSSPCHLSTPAPHPLGPYKDLSRPQCLPACLPAGLCFEFFLLVSTRP